VNHQRLIKSSEAAKHYNGLDGLRGAAALLVFFSHASESHLHMFGVDFTGIGKCGVALFFILSAHLLTNQFMQKDSSVCWTASNLKHYFIRRFSRIYPLYFVYLTTALLTTWASAALLKMRKPDGVPLTIDLPAWFQHMILTRGDGVTWSIAVEFKYYFILPLVAWILHKMRRNGPWSQIFLMFALITIAAILWPPSEIQGNDTRLRAYLGVFLTGSFCGLLGSFWERFPEWKYKLLYPLQIAGLLFIVITTPPLVKKLGLVNPENYHPEKWMFAHGLAFIPILFAAAYGSGVANKFFSNRFLRFVGMISFSLYLWHPVFIRGGARLLKGYDPQMVGWIALAGTLIASYISYRLFEKPFLNMGGKPKSADKEVNDAKAAI
jgi:peptidoglycan/LPS O-acetylase OafA/YrhL